MKRLFYTLKTYLCLLESVFFFSLKSSDAPRLEDADEKDVESYRSPSVPIATKARQNHQEELRLLQQPWWRKLGDEYQEEAEEENWINFDVQIKT